MKRNRKRRVEPRVLPGYWLAMVLLVAAISMGYVLLGTACSSLNSEIDRLDIAYDRLVEQCRAEENRWTDMTRPSSLERALNMHGINMELSHGEQVVLVKPVVGDGAYRSQTQYADAR